ncbi:hypothetical protein HY634_04460, partial [Candidatus Uhrbacteria bacterium]|nr:hypothetical protein [Candidatus Uhrbacteria bacterium]
WNLNGFHTDRVLSFPAMLFGSRFYRGVFESFWGFFLKDPYTGPGTRLYQTVLPNGTPNGWVCMGNERTRDALVLRTAGLGSWQEKVALLLEHFWWDSNFSDHVIDRLTANGPRLHPRLSSLARWEAASRTEPNFIHTVAWDPAGTVEDFVRHLMGGSR